MRSCTTLQHKMHTYLFSVDYKVATPIKEKGVYTMETTGWDLDKKINTWKNNPYVLKFEVVGSINKIIIIEK